MNQLIDLKYEIAQISCGVVVYFTGVTLYFCGVAVEVNEVALYFCGVTKTVTGVTDVITEVAVEITKVTDANTVVAVAITRLFKKVCQRNQIKTVISLTYGKTKKRKASAIIGGWFKSKHSFLFAGLITSIIFGLYHFQQEALGGLFWTYLFRRFGKNLWYPIISHAIFDTITLTLIYLGLFGR